MTPVTLTQSQARKIILHAAGLTKHGQFGKGKEAVYKLIDHLGFVQIDTNYVVERAHHHSIAARVPNYKLEWIEELQNEGRIFEFWNFATGYIPMHHFRFSLRVKESLAKRYKAVQPAEVNLMRKILDRIAREGPLRARDFENDRVTKNKGWWDWRPSKVALERLHFTGKLTSTRKKDFQKIYDLTENVIPRDVDTTLPEWDEHARHVIRRSLKQLGIANLTLINWNDRFTKSPIREEINKMIDEGEICAVNIEGVKGLHYMLSSYRNKKIELSGEAFILSPFDILNVFRKRLRDVFDFDYQVECFVVAEKRKYGYFALPILIGDEFVARMDSKADRKEKTFIVNNLHFEKVKFSKAMIDKLSTEMENFIEFNKCDKVKLVKTNDKVLARKVLGLS
ncbi:MAG TPA: crosslink repair DNA glycosylase YcaQ family protein [Cyclobacteriaceae bacterium]|nr:crosslink repair DNA glycosylase YcaQ family protein [Cyclobacteriaceae bacterium]